MNARRRRSALVVYAVVAALAMGWAVGFDVSIGNDPRPDLAYYLPLVVFVAAPWLLAAWLLWRAWWARAGASVAAMDAPALLLAAAAAALPDDRRGWGAAMTAELAQVQDRSSRWWFAAGCARAALLPPRGNRVPVLVAGALAVTATVAAGLAVGAAMPALRVFGVTFVGLVGALAVLAVARSRQVRPPASGLAVAAAGLAGVAVCVAVTGWFLVQYPVAAAFLSPAPAVFLAAMLAGCVWLALTPPRGLATDRLPRGIAVGAAVALGAGLVVTSRLGLRGVAELDNGIFTYLSLVPVAVIFAASALAAAPGRSFRAGLQAAVWTALLGSLAVFAVALVEAVRWYRFDTSLILAGDAVPLHAVGENLRNFMWGLVLWPFWWLPFGVLGAALGGAGWWRRRARAPRDPDPHREGHLIAR